jgi:acyl-coenzyme A thioesterase PaaI-like protein
LLAWRGEAERGRRLSDSQGGRLRNAWARLAGIPGGRALFSFLFGRAIPYSGTVRPRILELSPGRAVIAIRERRGIRNHLRSVHAVALANVLEMSTGLAMTFGMPEDARAIMVRLEIEYMKKARGRLVATATCTSPATNEVQDVRVTSEVRDEAGDVVAKGHGTWRVGPA